MKHSANAIIFNQDKTKVLITRRRDVDVWVLPGGGIELNETPEEAVKREVLEETGLVVKIQKKIGRYLPVNFLSSEVHLFECIVIGGKIETSAESRDIVYYPLIALPKNFFHIHLEWIQDALKNFSYPIERPLYSASYLNIIKYFFKHPSNFIKFLSTKLKTQNE